MVVRFISIKNVFILKRNRRTERFDSSLFLTAAPEILIRLIKTGCVFLLLSLYFCFCQSNQQDQTTPNEILPVTAQLSAPGHIDSLQQTYIELEIEELYWRNRVAMSGDASIDLVIDLVDSMVYLDIKGVTLRKTRISQFQISRSISYLKWYSAYSSWLSGPFSLKQDTVSSLPKQPVFIKDLAMYPLDYFDDWTYFTRLENEGPVHYILEYDRDLRVQVDQDSGVVPATELPGHWLRITIPATDAKAIYRALTLPSQLSLRY
jgi:hypothetical protein